jgi:hypothetical protein
MQTINQGSFLSSPKSYLLILLCSLSLSSFTQKSYFNFFIPYAIRGSYHDFKNGMKQSGFQGTIPAGWFSGSREAPYGEEYPTALIEFGRYTKSNTSLSLTAGIQEAGKIVGYNPSTGSQPNLVFTGVMLSPKINFHKSYTRFGIGPSVLYLQYRIKNTYADNSPVDMKYLHKYVPGLNVCAETAFSYKPKSFRVGVFAAIDLHPTFSTEPILVYRSNLYTNKEVYYQSTRINPSAVLAGLLFRIGK